MGRLLMAYYKEQAEQRDMSLNAFCIYAMDRVIEGKEAAAL